MDQVNSAVGVSERVQFDPERQIKVTDASCLIAQANPRHTDAAILDRLMSSVWRGRLSLFLLNTPTDLIRNRRDHTKIAKLYHEEDGIVWRVTSTDAGSEWESTQQSEVPAHTEEIDFLDSDKRTQTNDRDKVSLSRADLLLYAKGGRRERHFVG